MRIHFDPEDIEIIAEKVAERLEASLLKKPASEKEDEILTIEQAAQLLKTSKGQIYQWVSNSSHGICDFPFLKAGRLLRFSKKAIIRWLEANSKPLEKR